jgi:hypothetical protein
MRGIIAATREVCNATRRLGDGSRPIPRQSIRGSARAVRAVRNTRVFQRETRVVADVDEQRRSNREVRYRVLRRVLHGVTVNQNCSAESGYYNVLWADGNFRGSKWVLTAWVTYSPEYSDLHHLRLHVGVWCECPKNEIGHYVPSDEQHCQWNNSQYRTLCNANTMSADADLSLCHVV